MEASCSGSKEFDEARESIESLKNESEKLGKPHCGHIHVSEVLARISYIDKSVDITALGVVPNITHVAF